MLTVIIISCDEIGQILTHLRVVKKQILKEIKRQNVSQTDNEFECELSDDNCYGEHLVKIGIEEQ